ncbi:MAG TPA: response regulator transcription factor [Bacteroidota bacterium]|nr:response regulator transcription factor [Bacteroidota bacterium]
MARILLVEDEPQMQRGLRDNLEFEGHNVTVAGDGSTGLQTLLKESFDLVILDVMLPKMSGFDVVRKAREKGIGIPILMLTAKGDEIDKVLGLELGADDYITKPFSLRELIARVNAHLRRIVPSSGVADMMMTLGGVSVNFATYIGSKDGHEFSMTPKEFEILKYLWQHRNETVSRDDLLTEIWGYDESVSTRTVDNFVVKIRQKIEEDPSRPKIIFTMHGIGYKLIA